MPCHTVPAPTKYSTISATYTIPAHPRNPMPFYSGRAPKENLCLRTLCLHFAGPGQHCLLRNAWRSSGSPPYEERAEPAPAKPCHYRDFLCGNLEPKDNCRLVPCFRKSMFRSGTKSVLRMRNVTRAGCYEITDQAPTRPSGNSSYLLILVGLDGGGSKVL